jgi:hypothetical protein
MRPSLRVLTTFAVAFLLGASTSGQKSEAQRIATIYQQSFANPSDPAKLAALKKTLPRDGDYYVIEGDIKVTDQELEGYVNDQKQNEAVKSHVTSELIVNLFHGHDDFYKGIEQRTLTYAIDRASFGQLADNYTSVVRNMQQATQEWMNSCMECQIHFAYKANLDSSPNSPELNFVVQLHDVHGQYIAASFFPHDDKLRRFLNIDPSYFTANFDKVGVLRHELGHVLGYRHEHIRGIAGCYTEGNEWRPLTPYDPSSVMHYFCGGHGSMSLQLTQLDIQGHRQLYLGRSESNQPK